MTCLVAFLCLPLNMHLTNGQLTTTLAMLVLSFPPFAADVIWFNEVRNSGCDGSFHIVAYIFHSGL